MDGCKSSREKVESDMLWGAVGTQTEGRKIRCRKDEQIIREMARDKPKQSHR